MLGNNHTVQVSVKVNDQATDPLKRISNETKKMSRDFNQIGSSLGAFSNKLGSVVTNLDKMANSMYRFNMYTSSIQRNLKNIALIGVGAGAAIATDAVNKSVDFEFKTTKMQTKMGLTGTGGDSARKEIEQYILNSLSPNSMSSPSDIANLGIVLGQGGISSKDDMKNLLKTTTNFSEAVDTPADNAGKMLIASVKGFDLPMSKATDVTDKLAVALNKSLLEADELPHAIGELAGRSKMLGQSFESSLTALMMGKDQGMAAAQTAQDFLHGLRQLSQIGNTEFMTPKRVETFEKAGIDTSFFDTKKRQLKEFPEIISSLETTLQKQGLMPNREHFYEAIKQNGGNIPDGLLDKMSMMPMISKIFGAAGQAPLIMGLQSKYEETDKSGVKTGKTFYGSEALVKMREELLSSQGAVDEVHQKMGETARFQLKALSNVWGAAEIKLANDFLPVIKTASNELKKYIGGQGTAGSLDEFNKSVKRAADNLRVTNPELATLVETLGNITVGTIKIGVSLVPTVEEIGKSAKDNLVNTDWGSSIWTLPYYGVKNGTKFINDVVTNNTKSDAEIAKLPPELQGQANLVRGLVKGGIVLVAAGAIIKIIELAFRAVSTVGKGTKMAVDITKWISDMVFKNNKGNSPLADAMKDMVIRANIVNVHGNVVNDGKPGSPGTPGAPGGAKPIVGPDGKPISSTPNNIPPGKPTILGPDGAPLAPSEPQIKPGNMAIGEVAVLTALADAGAIVGAMSVVYDQIKKVNTARRNNEFQQQMDNTPPGQPVFGNRDEQLIPYKDPGFFGGMKDDFLSFYNEMSSFVSNMNTSGETGNKILTEGMGNINKSLENVKIENRMQFSPVIQISGSLREAVPNISATASEGTGIESLDMMNRLLQKQSKRYGE